MTKTAVGSPFDGEDENGDGTRANPKDQDGEYISDDKFEEWINKPHVNSGGLARREIRMFITPEVQMAAKKIVARQVSGAYKTDHDLYRDSMARGMQFIARQLKDKGMQELADEFQAEVYFTDNNARMKARRVAIAEAKAMLEECQSAEELADAISVTKAGVVGFKEPWTRKQMNSLIEQYERKLENWT